MFESGISISVSRDLRPPVAYPIALAMKFSPSEKTSYRKTGNIGNSKTDTAKGRNSLGADSGTRKSVQYKSMIGNIDIHFIH